MFVKVNRDPPCIRYTLMYVCMYVVELQYLGASCRLLNCGAYQSMEEKGGEMRRLFEARGEKQ